MACFGCTVCFIPVYIIVYAYCVTVYNTVPPSDQYSCETGCRSCTLCLRRASAELHAWYPLLPLRNNFKIVFIT